MGMSLVASGSGLMNIITGGMPRHQQRQKRQQVWTTCMHNEQQQEIREKGERGERQLARERGWERGEGKRWGEEDGKWVRGEQRMGREDALALIHRYTTHVIYAYIMIHPYIKLHIYHCIYIYI